MSATAAFAQTPPPPYFAVIFTSKRTASDERGNPMGTYQDIDFAVLDITKNLLYFLVRLKSADIINIHWKS